MFGVIKIERIGGGFFKRLHYRLFPPEPVIERISVLGSAPFFTLTLVCDENEEVDTGKIYSLLGRCAGRVIVCGGTITEDEKVKNFEPRILPSVTLFPMYSLRFFLIKTLKYVSLICQNYFLFPLFFFLF